MSAVILAQNGTNQELTCVSLATGTKCLSASAIPKCKGLVLHDCHAEVLALRGFNYWLLSEVQQILGSQTHQSPYLEFIQGETANTDEENSRLPTGPPLKIKDNISIHFFTTQAPCGDASMEILTESFPSEAATPWPVDDSTATVLQGRGHFSLLGYVRRKPARADAEASLSKSCTDKLAVKQFSSALSFPTDLFIRKTDSAYIQSLVVYADQYHSAGYERAFGQTGRLSKIGSIGHFFNIEPLPVGFPRFAFDRKQRKSDTQSHSKYKASNVSAVWILDKKPDKPDIIEVLINGVKQGYKQLDDKTGKASAVSRRGLWNLALSIGSLVGKDQNGEDLDPVYDNPEWLTVVHHVLSRGTYDEAKSSYVRSSSVNCRSQVTDSLGNWVKNTGDGGWSYS
ncbi:hypothetical protein H2200_007402 [Cladophialophora chaetospira]|uniref:A to I editase domain-containing protein n=1 Tax=Cladophialophora chaetospira TaxID=386627 RepID=A0AA39CHF5_9EURO|nr:hypothetical protein H2200_007402 [Cladophialophora chaetospira]